MEVEAGAEGGREGWKDGTRHELISDVQSSAGSYQICVKTVVWATDGASALYAPPTVMELRRSITAQRQASVPLPETAA